MISTLHKHPSNFRHHRCLVPGCEKAIDTLYPCCVRHRSRVPLGVRNDLLRSTIRALENPSKQNVDFYNRSCDEMVYFAASEDPRG